MHDLGDYLGLARDSGAFLDIELDILREALHSCLDGGTGPCRRVEVRDGRILGAFAILLKAAGGEFTWEVTTACVDPVYRDKGVPDRLLDLLEHECLGLSRSAILRFEISGHKLLALGEDLLPSRGYALLGHIKDFYAPGNDYYLYARHLQRPPGAPSEPGPGPERPAETAGTPAREVSP